MKNLGHGLFVWLFQRVSPVNDDVAIPDAYATSAQLSLRQRGSFVILVLEEAKSTVLLPVVRAAVDDHVHQAS